MSVSSTNRITNSPKIRKRLFEDAIKQKMINKNKAMRVYKKILKKEKRFKLAECTQCHRYMDKFLADKQLENKRLNAPICIPCIEGRPRKEIKK